MSVFRRVKNTFSPLHFFDGKGKKGVNDILRGYAKGHHNLAELKLKTELSKPERVEKENAFAETHRQDSDAELVEYIAHLKMKQGKAFDRYHFIGYCYAMERFGSWQNMITAVNLRIKEIKNDRCL